MDIGTTTFHTENYYTLADGQLYLGTQIRVKEFKGLVPLFIVSYCQTGDEYLDDYGKQGIMSLEILNQYFGELPFKQYSILLRKALPLEPGTAPALGMEHLQSSTFLGDTSGFRTRPMSQQELIETMPTYLHHMGHAFLPLRCYGDAYRPYVKEIPPIINNIWFNEGFMWFVPFETLKAEAWEQVFYRNTYKTDPQIRKMSLQELSQTASLMYGSDFRLGRAVYSRGASMAIEMNNYLKEKTGNKKSMRDVLRFLYYWSKENKRPFTMGELPLLLNKACGVYLSAIYNKWQLPIE
jgi:predicted metalloprotease with PDZ domain